MEVPAPQAGTVEEVKVKVGDRVCQGDLDRRHGGRGRAPPMPPKERITRSRRALAGRRRRAGYGSPPASTRRSRSGFPTSATSRTSRSSRCTSQPGATVKAEDPLITLESDKATMEVPSPAGRHRAGAQGQGRRPGLRGRPDPDAADSRRGEAPAASGRSRRSRRAARPARRPRKPPVAAQGDHHAEVLVLGAGPGGYTAAFRAADLGKKVVLVERWPTLGGVCLNVGCIPSKALLHAAKVIDETKEMAAHGIGFAAPVDRPRQAARLEGRRGQAADRRARRARQAAQGHGRQRRRPLHRRRTSSRSRATTAARRRSSFEQAIIAAGSEPVTLPFIPHDDPRVIDSTGALELDGVPKRLLVIGGGIIGLEMATVYHALGAKVTVVELMDQIIPGADKDIVTPLDEAHREALRGDLPQDQGDEGRGGPRRAARRTSRAARRRRATRSTRSWSRSAAGRTASAIGAENAGVAVDERGFIPVDKQMRTNVPHIFAIGDVVGQPMLAHKAMHEGKVAAEAAAGQNSALRRQGHPLGRLHRPRGRLGRADRERGQGRRASSTARACFPGRRAAARCRSAATRA